MIGGDIAARQGLFKQRHLVADIGPIGCGSGTCCGTATVANVWTFRGASLAGRPQTAGKAGGLHLDGIDPAPQAACIGEDGADNVVATIGEVGTGQPVQHP